MRYSIFLATLLTAVTSVAAHGNVQGFTADGVTKPGWAPFLDPYKVPLPVLAGRKVLSDGPVMDPSIPAIACNEGGEDGTDQLLDVNAGSDINFQWTNWPGDHLGPVLTLMASCNGDCSTFNPTDGKWFKIDEGGYTNGKWASEQLIANGNEWTSNIPAGLASGQYLVRWEIVALHSAGQPQYYPGCVQVNVKNGGADEPSPEELTSLPGMYDGFQWPDIWTERLDGFVVPGPKIVSFADGGSSDPSPAPSPSSVSSSRPQPTSTPANPTSTAICRAKRRSEKRSLPARRVHRRNTHH